jgi:ABC-type molybdate transport system permease subunit
MVATPAALLAQVKVTPPMVLPLLSFAVAVNCSVALAVMVGEDGVTAMVAMTGVTVRVSPGLVTPWADAVICVVPTATPVARPDELMVATPAALLAQVKVTPPMVLPLLSFAVAANCSVALAAMVGEDGVTAMLATTGLLGAALEPEEPPPQPV